MKGSILLVEDDALVREAMGSLLEGEGYEIAFAENGREALRYLHSGAGVVDAIILDLKMPVMDGWEFRAVQKDDPKLGLIPVLAISAEGGAKAAAISAQAYLRKPVDAKELLATLERILAESRQGTATRLDDTERLASLGRLAAGVGHEINNPLAFVMMNIGQSLEILRPSVRQLEVADKSAGARGLSESAVEGLTVRLVSVVDMLEDCQVGAERIRATVSNLQQLSGRTHTAKPAENGPLDIHQLLDQSVSMVWNQIRHRARLVKRYGKVSSIRGNGGAIGQVFLNLLVNAVHAIPEGDAEHNEIRISTQVEAGADGAQIVVEISDSGVGIAAEVLPHVFEPFFTTKPLGEGTGLGLSLSRQTVDDHGGHMTVESELIRGTVFRVYLPVDLGARQSGGARRLQVLAPTPARKAEPRGRVLVIDDEVLVGRVIRNALKSEHEVEVVERASEAIARIERGEVFDLVLCDVMMPDLNGPEFHAIIMARWPQLGPRLVFMTGGAFTPSTVEFMERIGTRVLTKPFKIDSLKRLVRERMRRSTTRSPGAPSAASAGRPTAHP